jgi:glycosyltransferase involved in cell wall biosynthesis
MTRAEIVIPCFNETENLVRLYAECRQIVANSEGKICFILVDNGSNDTTSEFVSSHQNSAPGVRFVSITPNRGYGGGILAGMRESTAEIIGWTHADLQTPLSDCLRALDILDQGYDFVKGRRIGRSFIDKFFSKGMGVFESAVFGKKLEEINAQPTMFSKRIFESWQDVPNDFSLDLYALVMAQELGARIARFDVDFLPRMHGSSKWNSGFMSRLRFIKRTLKFSFELKRRIR